MSNATPRILIIGDAVYVHIQRWVSGLATRLKDIHVLSPTPCTTAGATWIPDRVPPLRPWLPLRWIARRRRHLQRIFRTCQPDIIHAHFVGPFLLFPQDLPPHSRLVVSVWGKEILTDGPESLESRQRKAAILLAADRVVALSDALARATLRYCPIPETRLVRQYWGVDLAQFQRVSPLVNEPVIGFFKALLPKYGPEYLLRAFAKAKRHLPDARLLMIGDGDMRDALFTEAVQLGIERDIEWCGKVAHWQIRVLYERCAITAMPSTVESETLGVSALESQALRIPVVASRIGGIPESVRDGRTGLLVPPKDAQRLAEALVELLTNFDKRHQFAEAGHAFVQNNFDWNDTLAGMCEIFDQVLQSR